MINILFFVCCLVTRSASQRVDGMHNKLQEDFELERQLKIINKPPVKSIQTKFGYIVDCIDINKQPAFAHPLLKNHKLQRKPSNQKTIENPNLRNSPSKPKFGLEKPCPKGTVPIRRTTKNNLVQAKSLLDNQILAQQDPTYRTHVAGVFVVPFGNFNGVNGTSSVWQPIVEKDQSSAALTWVQNGPINALNEIAAGWHVAPQLYNGDVGTHLFAQWTVDTFQNTGCYNVLCSGYIQTDHSYYLCGRLLKTSEHNNIIEFQVGITQDPDTKSWWLNVENTNIGYFPTELFTNLALYAKQVGWGGRTTTHAGIPSPPMGSGVFPDMDTRGASYFRWVSFKNGTRYYDTPDYLTKAFTDNDDCYRAKFYGYEKNNIGSILQFGGLGGKCDN